MNDPITITDAAAALRDGSTTSVELTERAQRAADVLDGTLGTFITRYDETALEAAQRADELLAAGNDLGPLHGIPLGIKDIIACAEGPTTGQSVVHDPAWFAGHDAPVVARLRAAGAVITGKATTCEYAIGLPDASKPFPVPANPWDPTTWPGGSSSGSGSGVAAGLFLGALGTDTGGSIRMPASYCGISGLKQTYGLVPKSGCYPLGVTLDHIGPMARSARDCAAMLTAIAGFDPTDPSMIPGVEGADYMSALTGDLSGVTVGIDRVNHLGRTANDPRLGPTFEAAIAVLQEAGARVVEVILPYYAELTTVTMATLQVEAFAYHQRNLAERYTDYGRFTRPMIAGGSLLTAADYAAAQKVRRIAKSALTALYETVDLIATPTCGTGSPSLHDLSIDGLMETIFTSYWNPVGNPALSVPMGFTDAGLPLGLQIAGRPLEDSLVLRAGDAYQRLTEFHLRQPPVVANLAA